MIIDRFIFWQLLATLDNFPNFFHSPFRFFKTKNRRYDPVSYLLHFFYVLKRLRSTTNSVIFQLFGLFVFHYIPQFVCHSLFPVYIILIKKILVNSGVFLWIGGMYQYFICADSLGNLVKLLIRQLKEPPVLVADSI